MSFDTRFTYQPLPYNSQDQDKHTYNNYMGTKPSYRYKNSKVIWLNSAYRSSDVSSGTTYNEMTWDIPPFQLFNRTKLSVISYTSNESSAKPIIIKIRDLNYDYDSTYSSDKDGTPILFASHTGVASQLNNNQFSLILLPSQINKITLILGNSFTARNNGFTISGGGAGHFILGLLFEDDDLVLDDASSQYK